MQGVADFAQAFKQEAVAQTSSVEDTRRQFACGYLISRYPAISHTFILREIRELRRLGITIDVSSINAPDRSVDQLTREEREEAQKTFYIKRKGPSGAILSNVHFFLTRPIAYLKCLTYAVTMGGLDLRQFAKHIFYFVEAAMCAEWVHTRKLQHLHVHFATPASTVALLVARLMPITLSMTVHGPDEFDEVTLYRLREKVKACRFICVISSYTRSQLMRLSDPVDWGKIHLLPLGVDIEHFSPWEKPESETFEILCVGRLAPAKGQQILLTSLRLLLQQGRRVHLRLVGDGPVRDALEGYVRQHSLEAFVTFTGSVNQDQIQKYYRSADCFALASFAEGLPIVLMEAMAMGLPCVSTSIAGIPELIRDNIEGLLVHASDEVALAVALSRLMDDRLLGRCLGQAARRRVVEKFNLSRNVRRLAEVFNTYSHVERSAAA